jgi:hypothetical protein
MKGTRRNGIIGDGVLFACDLHALFRHFQEEQGGEQFEVVLIRYAVVTQDSAVVSKLLDWAAG